MIAFKFSVTNDIGGGCHTEHQIDCVISDIGEACEKGAEAAVLIRAFSESFTEEWEET